MHFKGCMVMYKLVHSSGCVCADGRGRNEMAKRFWSIWAPLSHGMCEWKGAVSTLLSSIQPDSRSYESISATDMQLPRLRQPKPQMFNSLPALLERFFTRRTGRCFGRDIHFDCVPCLHMPVKHFPSRPHPWPKSFFSVIIFPLLSIWPRMSVKVF